MDIATLLNNTLSADNTTRENATAQLTSAAVENFPAYMHMLAAELANNNASSFVRNAAGLAFKNSLTGRSSDVNADLSSRWRSLDPSQKSTIKTLCLSALATEDRRAASVAAQAVAAIAAVELPAGEWPELIGQLLEFVQSESVGLRISTLQCVGYICEVIDPAILATRSNEILTAVVQGARKEETSAEVQGAAIQALYNSLEFIRDNFEREGERNYIMQVVCEATQSPSIPVQVGAFECLVRIMHLYYDKMALYMERALFGLTVLGMQNPEEKVALQAVEFWATVCDEEQELALEAAEAAEYGDKPDMESKHFAKTALPEILPVMLQLLLKQDEDADDDEWNISMAAGACIGLLAGVVSDTIVQPVIPFIEANIRAEDWHQREAAVMAFGAILDGPDADKLTPLVQQALPTLIGMMQDPHPAVKDTVAWTLGRITELMVEAIQPNVHLQGLIQALIAGLNDAGHGRIASNAAWAVKNLAQQIGGDLGYSQPTGMNSDAESSMLSPYYNPLMETLMNVTNRSTNEGNARTAAYEALSDLALYSANDTIQLVSRVGEEMLSRMEKLIGMQNQLLGMDDRASWNELQSNCCSVVGSVVRKLGPQVQPLADRIMTVSLQLLATSAKEAAVAEDAFMPIGHLVNALGGAFEKYIPHLMEYIYPALAVLDEFQVFTTAVGLTGDLARAVGKAFGPYAQTILQALLAALASPILHRTAKPTVVAAFGDIGMALETDFTPYLEHVMSMLSQAGAIQVDASQDMAMSDFIWSMRESIADAFVGIVNGYARDPSPLAPYVGGLIGFIQKYTADEDATDNFVRSGMNLLGDLATSFKNTPSKELFQTEGVLQTIQQARAQGRTKNTLTAVKYAKASIKALV